MNTGTWGFKVLLYFDIFLCGVIWRDADVTISSMTGLERRKPQPKWWARFMPLTTTHCEKAIAADIQRAEDALKLLHSEDVRLRAPEVPRG